MLPRYGRREARAHRIRPVPTVKRRMRHERVEAGSEHDRSDDHRHREAPRPRWRNAPAMIAANARIERKANSGHRRHRRARRCRTPRDMRPASPRPVTRGAVCGGAPVGQRHRRQRQHDDQCRRARGEDRPVEGDAKMRIDRSYQAEAERSATGRRRPLPPASSRRESRRGGPAARRRQSWCVPLRVRERLELVAVATSWRPSTCAAITSAANPAIPRTLRARWRQA